MSLGSICGRVGIYNIILPGIRYNNIITDRWVRGKWVMGNLSESAQLEILCVDDKRCCSITLQY